MKVFVGYGYNSRDAWIPEYVFPLLNTLGFEVLTGENIPGEVLSEGVIRKIQEADACIGFLTKRESDSTLTHKWVIEELATALASKKEIYEIRENGIDEQSGITGDRQYYHYDGDKAMLLVMLAKFIVNVKTRLSYKEFILLPEDISEQIRMNLSFTRCTYQFLHKAKEYEVENAQLRKKPSGYAILIRKIPSEDALIDIRIESPSGSWSSGYVSVGLINVLLTRDN
ncbi:hypothetical protein [Algoriphagus sp.]|uniref:hypothetical protein n=1 Tax=Algoriphagus sp. TaxID=1872435 RepID=UPI0025D8DE76|nr:hypothetical protein [Algoriphagus sp.]